MSGQADMKFLFYYIIFACVIAAASVSALNRNPRSTPEDHPTSYFNTTFLKVIPTTDVSERDAIYWTPPEVLIGKADGTILRCLYENPDRCEVLYKARTYVNYIVISGYDIYAGVGEGTILWCNLFENSCRTFYRASDPVYTLTVGGRYLYAGLNDTTVLRCQLQQPGSCRQLYSMDDQVYSLIQFNGYLYVGLKIGKLMRCPLHSDNNCNFCTKTLTISSAVKDLTIMRNKVLIPTWEGRLYICSRNLQSGDCSHTDLNFQTSATASFNGYLYAMEYKKGVRICRWSNGISCSDEYVNHENIISMAFVYGSRHMQSRYRNEDTSCTWQSNSECPPFVPYYDKEERITLEIHVIDGKLYNAQGQLVDTSDADEGHSGLAAIFAMGPDGRILLSNSYKRERRHTSSLFAGEPVAGAGEMVVKDGVIQKIMACSEHYRPDLALNMQVIQSLRTQGYTGPIDSQTCFQNELCDHNVVQTL